MNTLVKIAAFDCPVCTQMSPLDEELAEQKGFFFQRIELDDLASGEGPIRDYIVPMYVVPNDGNIELPIYLILEDGNITASMVIKTMDDLTNLFLSWELYKKSRL